MMDAPRAHQWGNDGADPGASGPSAGRSRPPSGWRCSAPRSSLTGLGGTADGIGPSGGPRAMAPLPPSCRDQPHAAAIADALMAGRYRLGGFPAVTLPSDLTWAEDPLHDINWRVRLHSMSWLDSLTGAWRSSGSERYRRRVRFLVDDWLKDNPRTHPATRWAWYDQTTGIRTSALVCAASVLGWWPRLRRGLAEHGRTLADPSFYTGVGNHALDQSIGLLDVGVAMGRRDWADLAQARIASLLIRSVSAAGITNEQAVGYQAYNQQRYLVAAARLTAYGMPAPPAFVRVTRMSRMLAQATLPDGRYVMIGDTEALPVRFIPGSEAAFAATAGRSGRRPPRTLLVDRGAGWLFARTGWGTERPFRDEAVMSLRFGRGPVLHGHDDAGSVTLYGAGSSLVLDPGKYQVHPVRAAELVRQPRRAQHGHGGRRPIAACHAPGRRPVDRPGRGRRRSPAREARGSAQIRRVVFSRRSGWMVVEDRIDVRGSAPVPPALAPGRGRTAAGCSPTAWSRTDRAAACGCSTWAATGAPLCVPSGWPQAGSPTATGHAWRRRSAEVDPRRTRRAVRDAAGAPCARRSATHHGRPAHRGQILLHDRARRRAGTRRGRPGWDPDSRTCEPAEASGSCAVDRTGRHRPAQLAGRRSSRCRYPSASSVVRHSTPVSSSQPSSCPFVG